MIKKKLFANLLFLINFFTFLDILLFCYCYDDLIYYYNLFWLLLTYTNFVSQTFFLLKKELSSLKFVSDEIYILNLFDKK